MALTEFEATVVDGCTTVPQLFLKRAREDADKVAMREKDFGIWNEYTWGDYEARARAEAARCAICGTCAKCRACIDLFGCPAFYVEDGHIRVDPALCSGCGACVSFCPNGAIRPIEQS